MRWEPHSRPAKDPSRIHLGHADPAARGWSAGIALATVLVAAFVIFDAPAPLRPLAVLLFLAFGPGLGLIGLFGISDLTQRLVLSIGVSLALDTIVTGLCLYAGLWSPITILWILIAITLVGAGLQFRVAAGGFGDTAPASTARGVNTGWVGTETIPTGAVTVAPNVNVNAAQSMIAVAAHAPSVPRRNPRLRPVWIVAPTTLLLVLAGGLAVPVQPLLLLPLFALAVVLALTTLEDRSETLFLESLGILILGYIFMGNGFASIGVSPIHVGEIVLLLGVAAVVIGRVRLRHTAVEVSLIMFIALGALRTASYLASEGFTAIRDAELWFYATFALLVSWFMTEHRLRITISGVHRVLPILLIWLALMPFTARVIPSRPSFPGAADPMIFMPNRGEQAVIIVALVAFVISGLYVRRQGRWQVTGLAFWFLLLVPALIIAVSNRGGMLSIWIGLGLLMILKPSRERLRPVQLGIVAVAVMIVWNPSVDTGNSGTISVQQLMITDSNILSEDTVNAHEVPVTKQWRLQGWKDIVGTSTTGADFWTSTGLTIGLADDDRFQTSQTGSLRSAESIHMTVLARTGVPGLMLWIVLQLSFANQVIRAYRTSRARRERFWTGLYAWILPVWLAALVLASFDGYLGSPQGAIPFWCLFGFGLGALRVQEHGRPPGSPWVTH